MFYVAAPTLLVSIVALIAGYVRIPSPVRLGMAIAGPLVALIVFEVANPEGGCSYDCPARALWGLTAFACSAAWLGGLGLGMLARRIDS